MREQGMFDPAHLVFVDETAANTKMVRLSGRCRRGERLIGRVPQGHWKTITFVAALRRNGMRAPCTLDGSMNGAKFLAYVKRCLAATLRRKDNVILLLWCHEARTFATPFSLALSPTVRDSKLSCLDGRHRL